MPYGRAVETGMYLATMGDSRQDLKLGHLRTKQGRNFQTKLKDVSTTMDDSTSAARRRRLRGRGLRRQQRESQIHVQNALSASISAASARTYEKVEKTLTAKIHKFTYRKAMIPMWKMLARFRTLTTFTPGQMRQFLYGVALTMHMFTKYNRRVTNLHSQLRSVFILVFLPFAIPPVVVLVIPSMIFLVPLFIVVTAFTALNRQAKQVMERNRKPLVFEHRQSIFVSVSKSAFSTLSQAGSVVGGSLQKGSELTATVAGGLGEGIRRSSEVISLGGSSVHSTVSGISRRSSGLLKKTSGTSTSGRRRRSFFLKNSANEKPLRPSQQEDDDDDDDDEYDEEFAIDPLSQSEQPSVSTIASSGHFDTNNNSRQQQQQRRRRRHSYNPVRSSHQSSSNSFRRSSSNNSNSSSYQQQRRNSSHISKSHHERRSSTNRNSNNGNSHDRRRASNQNNHHQDQRNLTNSTLTNSWDLEMVSSFESSDSNNSVMAAEEDDPEAAPFTNQLLLDRLDTMSSSTRSLVDTTPNTIREKSSMPFLQLPWWRTSSNDTPTTNNTEPSSVLRSSMVGRNSGNRSNKNRRANNMKRRVSFAAAVEEHAIVEREYSFRRNSYYH